MSPTRLFRWSSGIAVLAALSRPPESLRAQSVEPRATVLLSNRHLWRGIRRAAGWNLQPELSLGLRRGSSRVAAGVWSDVELSTHRDSSLTDLRPGDWGFSEFDFWAEAGHEFTAGSLAAGFVWYQYRGRSGDVGTGEVYARFRGSGRNRFKLSPEVSLWYDPVKRNSAYLETAATVPVLALPLLRPTLVIYTGATAGFAIGQSEAPQLASSFEETGLTHVDVATGIRARYGTSLGSLLLNLAGHLMYARDPATLRESLRPDDDDEDPEVRPYLTVEGGLSWPAYRHR